MDDDLENTFELNCLKLFLIYLKHQATHGRERERERKKMSKGDGSER